MFLVSVQYEDNYERIDGKDKKRLICVKCLKRRIDKYPIGVKT